MATTRTKEVRFHGYRDAGMIAAEASKDRRDRYGSWRVEYSISGKIDFNYRFRPHFHPYSEELLKRLVQRSVPGLQAIDTEYLTNASIKSGGQAQKANGAFTLIGTGTRIVLPEDAQVRLGDGTLVRLSGGKVMKVEGGDIVHLAPGATITIPAGGMVILSSGEAVNVRANVDATLKDGKPTPRLYDNTYFARRYSPRAGVVDPDLPVKELEFASDGAYSVYNWELFYHVPLTMGIHLCKNSRFEEAQKWLSYIFDPTDSSDGPTPDRFWKVKPFQTSDVQLIEEIMLNLSTGADPSLRDQTIRSIGAWKASPFRPHVVARYRFTAFMFKAVMAYLDNLIAWGDSLFRQDTRETVAEATQLYVLAANLLGPRPQEVPKKGKMRPTTYANIASDLDAMGNVIRSIEADIPFDLLPPPPPVREDDGNANLRSLGYTLYFCVPRNDRLLEYWTTVADRLFKIRNSLNIQGIFRQLPLFQPPIDPGMLAKAAAAGLDIGAVISGANQPLPLVRFRVLIQKAMDICQEVKSLGSNLLAALEKKDNEKLSALRARHEKVILELTEMVRYSQLQEATKNLEGLEQSLVNVFSRYLYYEEKLGAKRGDVAMPDAGELDVEGLKTFKFRSNEPVMQAREIEVDISSDLDGEASGKLLSSLEVAELDKLKAAKDHLESTRLWDLIGAATSVIPNISANIQPMGTGASISFGGSNLAAIASFVAMLSRHDADDDTYSANKKSKIGAYGRREEDWAFQSNLAVGEINQSFKQFRAAQIREAMATHELESHQRQIEHAADIEQFLTDEKKGKTTSEAFYTWMKREVHGLYSQCFQFAYEVAQKAERALQHELGDQSVSYLQFGYLSGKEGLLAGEKLYLDIKRMEMAYLDQNRREYELTKHVSLRQVDPMALLTLRATGMCKVVLPEQLFDLDCPGHYFRRIKSVALSIPCITGPHTGVNCAVRLLKSTIRTKSTLVDADSYAREAEDDNRFSDHFGTVKGIVTSSAQNDNGLFEANLHDDRYLPFEGAGAVSEWHLELPSEIRQFDYDTITDIVLHLQYTAREGGQLLREGAVLSLNNRIDDAQTYGSNRLFSIRHEFPTEWARFKAVKIDASTPRAELALKLKLERYPYWAQDRGKSVRRVDLLARVPDGGPARIDLYSDMTGNVENDPIATDPSLGDLRVGKLEKIPLPSAQGSLRLFFADNSISDLWLVLNWGK